MNLHTWHDFVAMGGHGLYVWGAFGGAALLLSLELFGLRLLKAGAEAALQIQANLGSTHGVSSS